MMSLSQQRRRTDKSQSIAEAENDRTEPPAKEYHLLLPAVCMYVGIGLLVGMGLASALFLLHVF